MKRRQFILALGAAVSATFAARAQQAAMPVIGFLHSASPEPNAKRLAGFRKGLQQAGFVEGQNVTIEFRWAAGQNARLPELAAELIARPVNVIATLSSHAGDTCGEGRDHYHSDRLPDRRATGRARPRRQPQPAGRQRHRHQQPECRACCQSGSGCCASWCRRRRDIAVLLNPSNPQCEADIAALAGRRRTLGRAAQCPAGRHRRRDRARLRFTATRPPRCWSAPIRRFSPAAPQLVALAAKHAIPTMYDKREVCRGRRSDELCGQASRAAGNRPASMSAASSRAPSRPNCRSCSRPSSNWSSISRPRSPSASRCRRRCWPAPTR